MTALNVFLDRDTAQVFSDGAFVGPDGRLAYVSSKIHVLPHIPAVIAARGANFWLTIAAGALERFGSFDELTDNAVERLRTAPREYRSSSIAGRLNEPAEFIIVGWSERDGAMRCFTIRAGEWKLVPVTEGMVSPGSPAMVAPLQAEGLDLTADLRTISEDQGLALLRQQRLELSDEGGVEPFRYVGCLAQLTTVTRDSVSTRILERWPDRVGERIEVGSRSAHLRQLQRNSRDALLRYG